MAIPDKLYMWDGYYAIHGSMIKNLALTVKFKEIIFGRASKARLANIEPHSRYTHFEAIKWGKLIKLKDWKWLAKYFKDLYVITWFE